jgi:hypothetical protein
VSQERLTLRLFSVTQAWQEMKRAWEWLKPILTLAAADGREVRYTLEIRPETRSDKQNRLLHSRLNDVAKQCTWAGRKWDVEAWKRLMTAAWCRVRNEGVEMVPAIDGKGFDVLYQRTSKLTRAESAELSEYVMAWGSEQGVRWCIASLAGEVDAETGEILEAA